MARGGARNRSGPQPDPMSGRSDARGLKFDQLPAEGYDGEVPEFPLMQRSVLRWEYEDKRRFEVFDPEATEAFAEREAELWRWAWRTPQALVWVRPECSWMQQIVARWVRQAVLCEGPDSSAADHGQLHRYAEQVGLTAASLTRLGWKIVPDAAPPAKTTGNVVEMQPRRLRG